VRVFGGDAAEIVPHAADDIRYLTLGQLRKRTLDIATGTPGDSEKRADQPPDRAADGASVIDWQWAKDAK